MCPIQTLAGDWRVEGGEKPGVSPHPLSAMGSISDSSWVSLVDSFPIPPTRRACYDSRFNSKAQAPSCNNITISLCLSLSVVNLREDFKVCHHHCNKFPELNSLCLQYLCFLLSWLTQHNKINLPLQKFIEHLLFSNTEEIPHCLFLTGHPQCWLCFLGWPPVPTQSQGI